MVSTSKCRQPSSRRRWNVSLWRRWLSLHTASITAVPRLRTSAVASSTTGCRQPTTQRSWLQVSDFAEDAIRWRPRPRACRFQDRSTARSLRRTGSACCGRRECRSPLQPQCRSSVCIAFVATTRRTCCTSDRAASAVGYERTSRNGLEPIIARRPASPATLMSRGSSSTRSSEPCSRWRTMRSSAIDWCAGSHLTRRSSADLRRVGSFVGPFESEQAGLAFVVSFG